MTRITPIGSTARQIRILESQRQAIKRAANELTSCAESLSDVIYFELEYEVINLNAAVSAK